MTTATGKVVGFIGLGNMGIPMTTRLVAAGYQVRGFDSSPAAMANFTAIAPTESGGAAVPVDSLGSAGEGADAVIVMLPDSDIVERVILGRLASEPPSAPGGLLATLPPGTTLIDMSSSDPARTKILARLTAQTGVTLIDAPVSGGVAGAKAGTLAVMVGGSAESFERFKPMLSAIGKRVVHAGDVGAGHAVKALNNLMSAANLLISCEALTAGQRFGLDPAVMLEIINGSSGRSANTENKWPNYILTGTYDDGFALRLMVKDIKLALAIEHATGVPATASEAVATAWESALADLPPGADHTAIARWLSTRPEQ
ncbi:NAD(P)-dependent oxidoreductase [Trebonia kvetii]|uniref:NAD(P)-dependent oxidoreductase n=1 Tax=Trebonia kvetii TaxID=2480626 RepID=A0A6P2CAR7_9ACTN|nr:NAD(P)-dependent oxidoreductase [Trebonia kvetii]TVZ07041.1 NAD(P)-dependent oxidoreductase [Trebonia kvetii]